MKLTELNELVDRVADKTDEYVSISIIYNNFPTGTKETYYTFYREKGLRHENFDTVQDIKSYMENILSPIADEGIDINDMAEEGAE